MKFEPAIHTKEYLFSHVEELLSLLAVSPDIVDSHLCNDVEFLSFVHNKTTGDTVAHELARRQPQWHKSISAENHDILKLADVYGVTVAHRLSIYSTCWHESEAFKNTDILKLSNERGWPVAYSFIQNQKLTTHHYPLFKKPIATLVVDGILLAETIAEHHGSTPGLDLISMIMNLITQGAAYKHSVPLDLHAGHTLIVKMQEVMSDCVDPLIGLKQLQAFYSTCEHNKRKISAMSLQETFGGWEQITIDAETMLRRYLDTHPELFETEPWTDVFCEPADDLFSRIKSERIIVQSLNGIENAMGEPNLNFAENSCY